MGHPNREVNRKNPRRHNTARNSRCRDLPSIQQAPPRTWKTHFGSIRRAYITKRHGPKRNAGPGKQWHTVPLIGLHWTDDTDDDGSLGGRMPEHNSIVEWDGFYSSRRTIWLCVVCVRCRWSLVNSMTEANSFAWEYWSVLLFCSTDEDPSGTDWMVAWVKNSSGWDRFRW